MYDEKQQFDDMVKDFGEKLNEQRFNKDDNKADKEKDKETEKEDDVEKGKRKSRFEHDSTFQEFKKKLAEIMLEKVTIMDEMEKMNKEK